jgi:hypothetical protein
MSKSTIWYGYLDAGEKSSPVVIDERLNTGNPQTLYVFNLARGKILEYRRDIAEPKLRELKAAEQSVVSELKTAFDAARHEFRTRGARILNLPERGAAVASAAEPLRQEDEDLDFEDFDIDLVADDEEAEELDDVEEM